MRAKTVNENLDFERGRDPRAALSVGSAQGGEVLFNMIYEACRTNPEVFIFPKSPTTATGWDWMELSDGDGTDPVKYFKLVMKEFESLYNHREISVILMESGNVYFFEGHDNYYILKDLSDFWEYFNKKSQKKKRFSKKYIGESANFERGKDPKSAMSIGRANLNYFQNSVKYSTPFEQLLGEMIFTHSFQDHQILEKAAKLLGVEENEVRIACNEYDEALSGSEVEQHAESHEWTYYNEDETEEYQLIQASTLEIYVVHREYNDLFLMLLGAIY